MKRLAFLMIMLVCAAAPASAAPEKGKTLFIHVKSQLSGDDARMAIIPLVVVNALRQGSHVVLYFDAGGATAVRMGRWYGGHSTPLDRAAIRSQERRRLADLLGLQPADLPDNYGDLLHFLKGRGVAVYVNKTALQLRGIKDDEYDHAAEAITEERMIELLGQSTIYVSY